MKLYSFALKGWNANGAQDHLLKWVKAPSREAVQKFLAANNLELQHDALGNSIRLNGFRRCEKVSKDEGARLVTLFSIMEKGDKSVWDWLAEIRAELAAPCEMWTMRDGTKIKVKDMTDGHLANALRMLQRKLMRMAAVKNFELVKSAIYCTNEDIKQDLMADSKHNQITWDSLASKLPSFAILHNEAVSRGVSWQPDEQFVTKYQAMHEVKNFIEWHKRKEGEEKEKLVDQIWLEETESNE